MRETKRARRLSCDSSSPSWRDTTEIWRSHIMMMDRQARTGNPLVLEQRPMSPLFFYVVIVAFPIGYVTVISKCSSDAQIAFAGWGAFLLLYCGVLGFWVDQAVMIAPAAGRWRAAGSDHSWRRSGSRSATLGSCPLPWRRSRDRASRIA